MTVNYRFLLGLSIASLALGVLFFSPYILFFIFLLTWFWVDFFMCKKAVANLDIRRRLSSCRLFEHEPYMLFLNWSNPSSIELNMLVSPSDNRKDLSGKEACLLMPPRSKGELSFEGTFLSYGKASLGRTVLCYQHPLGLFHFRRTLSFNEDILVFPRLPFLDFNREALNVPLPGKKAKSRLMEDPADLIKVRPYEREPWHHIHWKISAKLDQWMVKEFGFSASGAVHLLLDLNRPVNIYAKEVWSIFRRQYERHALMATARLIWRLWEEKVPISVTCKGASFFQQPLGRRDPVYDLEQLLVQTGTDHPDMDVIHYFLGADVQSRPSDTVVLFAMHLDKEQLPDLIRLRSQCAKVMALLFPYGVRDEERAPRHSAMSAHPLMNDVLKMASELSSHHIHVHFVTEQTSLQEGIHAFSS